MSATKSDFFQTPIEFLKGVGPARADLLKKELGVEVFEDLLQYYPFRHVDRSRYYRIAELQESLSLVQLQGRIISMNVQGEGGKRRLVAQFSDGSGQMELIWFQGIKWVQAGLKLNEPYVIFGKPSLFRGSFSMVHPELEILDPSRQQNGLAVLQPVYATTDKLRQRFLDPKGIAKLTWQLLEQGQLYIRENLPLTIRQRYRLMDRNQAFRHIHFPDAVAKLEAARRRLKFEELFFLQFGMIWNKRARKAGSVGFRFEKVGSYFHKFYNEHLPFQLTEAQKHVLREIRVDVGSGKQMNRLLQGDVGSGKTVVALLSMLLAADNGYQSCLMAPTEILATQHYQAIADLLEGTGLEVGLLTGSTRTKERRILHEKLRSGELHFLVGTHALIEPEVQFQNLGLTIIDEQHRFGVAQRAALWSKNTLHPHVLVMTATPIPRTLAMTMYGDLDVSVINELPKGRKPIKTIHATDAHRVRVFDFMREQISLGRQVYVVYPMIEESDKSDLKYLMDGYESICRAFPRPQYQVSIVHGKMKPEDKQGEMKHFALGKSQILVATTVIEVGVNVPNASVMVIENAERFGLSQLHQLRGRVGRGAEQSYCILMTKPKLGEEGATRIKTMVETNDGFRIAEVDLQLRGPGDMAGTQQSGVMDFSIASLTEDGELLAESRQAVEFLFEHDPALQSDDARMLLQAYQEMRRKHQNWSSIS